MTERKKQLLLAMAVSTVIARAGIAQVVTSTDVGPSFIVPDTIPNNPQYPDQPDGRIAYLPDPLNPGEYEMYWAGGNYVSEGTSVTSQSGPLNSNDLLPGTPAPSYDQHNWLMSVYPLSVSEPGAPAGDLIGFFHAEDYNFSGVTGGTWKSQGVAYSTNDGLTWTIGGQILSVPKPSVVSQGGFGDMSVVWNPATSTWYSFTGEGPYGAESTSPTGAPGTWSMYSNGGFNSSGLNGTPTALPGLQNYSGGSPDYIYSTYLGEWCRVWVDSFSGGRNVLLSTTSDLIHYDPVVTLVTNRSAVNSIAYPTVIGTSDVTMGQNAWLYSAVFLPSGSRQFTAEAVHLSKVTAVPTTYTGAGGDGNWATAGNWGGTTITDEGQSLIFSSVTGSSQTNNLAAGIRVQGITFAAGAGANVITPSSGNTLELEGDFVNNSTATQTYDGNIDQQTAQINFNAAAGNIVIGGTVNVTNSGGLIVSGSKNVALGGVVQTGLLFGNGGGYADTQIIKNGTGTLILNGPGTFAGQTFVNSGTVQLGDPLALKNSTVDLAVNNSLNLNGLNATLGWLAGGGSLSLGTSTSLTLGNTNLATNYATPNYFGTLSGNGSLVKNGSSLQILSGNNLFTGSILVSGGTLILDGSNDYAGGTNLSGGTLATPFDASLGTMGVTFNGGTLQALAGFSSSRDMLLSGGGTIDTNGQILTLSGNLSGGGLLTKIGAGILVLRGNDSATGGILVKAAEINAASTTSLGNAGLNISGGALQLGASFDPSVVGITIGSGGGTIDTNGFNSTFATTIGGSGGLYKIGAGTLSFAAAPSYAGATNISGGTLQATTTSGGVLGSGAISINGGSVSILPSLVSSASNISVTIGSAANPAITTSGAGAIVLGKSGNSSLTVTLGEAGGVGIAQSGNGTITIANASGISNLGSSSGERLLVAGNAPTVINGIVAPWTVGQASTSSSASDFLTYSISNGFQKATSYTARTGTFTPVANEISNITGTATVNSGNPYAVRLGAYTLTVSNAATLTVGNGTYGGVILNGGTITGGTLAFNTASAIIYTSVPSTISSMITGTGGLTVFGPGSLVLSNSANTLSGNIVVNGAALNGTTDSALGSANNIITLNGGVLAPGNGYTQSQPVTVGPAGGSFNLSNSLTLTGALTGSGTLNKNGNGTLIISGGSADALTGPISINTGILQTASGASLASTTGGITVATGTSFDAFGNYDGTIISNPIWLSGTGTGAYGALNGGGNVTLSGAITLNADTTISHDYNYFLVNSSITGANHNLTLASTQLGQPYMSVNEPITLGSGSLTVTGSNGTSLNAVDSYSGGTNVSAGTLQLGNSGALGSGGLNVTGGTVDLNGLSVTVNGLSGTSNGIIASSGTTSNSTLTVNQTGSSNFGGTLADTISPGTMQLCLNVTGSGSLALSGTNTFSGVTRVISGTLILTSSLALQNSTLDLDASDTGTISFGSLPAVTLGGLEGGRNLSNSLPLTIGSNGQTTVYSGNLIGTGSIIKTGNGLLEFIGTNNYSGGTTIDGGALQFDTLAAIPATPTLLTLNAGGAVAATGAYNGVNGWLTSGRISSSTAGALALTSNSSETINLTTAGGGAFSNVTLGAVGNVTYTGVYTPLGNTYRFGGGGGTLNYSDAISGSKSIAMANPGTLVLMASNNYSGGTIITAGTVQLGASSAIGTGAVNVSGSGTLNLNGYSVGSIPLSLGGAGVNSLGALQNGSATANATSSGAITLTANATIGVDNAAYAGRMDIGGGVTCINGSTYTLIKAGPGVLRINGGTFTVGAINVSAGTLDVLANNNVLIAGRPVSVASGATLFLYNDNDAANTVLMASGTLEDNTGANTVSGSTTLSGSGNTNFSIDSAVTLIVSGAISGSGGLNITGNSGLAVVLTNSNNAWTGGTTLNTGTLQVGSGGTGGVLPGNISNNTALVFDRADTLIYAGSISGTGSVSQVGGGIVILSGTNSYTGGTNVSIGTLILTTSSAVPNSSALMVAAGGKVVLANHSGGMSVIPVVSSLSNSGSVDLTNNGMIIHNGSISAISSQIAAAFDGGLWNGSGGGLITSSTAAADTTHLTAVGVAIGLSRFEGQAVSSSDVLIKYTYYGDADLSGTVDGSDYSRIDNGYLSHATGWYNGDFNYDGLINGSDYTLIDNAFNSQGTQITTEVATPTAELAQTASRVAVPEPALFGFLVMGVTGLLGRRSRV